MGGGGWLILQLVCVGFQCEPYVVILGCHSGSLEHPEFFRKLSMGDYVDVITWGHFKAAG